jgi:hypothetical protein
VEESVHEEDGWVGGNGRFGGYVRAPEVGSMKGGVVMGVKGW